MKKRSTDFFKVLLIVILFLLAMYLVKLFESPISTYLDFGYLGMIFYILLGVVATVAAPISTIPLIPVATTLWGPFTTALLSIFAWTIGAIIAFVLARRYGKPILNRYVDLEKVSRYEKLFGTTNIFWNIVILRMMIPVDILSYAIGLFTSVNLKTYVTATVIGISPFAFLFSYLPNMEIGKQLAIGAFMIFVVYVGYIKFQLKNKGGALG